MKLKHPKLGIILKNKSNCLYSFYGDFTKVIQLVKSILEARVVLKSAPLRADIKETPPTSDWPVENLKKG